MGIICYIIFVVVAIGAAIFCYKKDPDYLGAYIPYEIFVFAMTTLFWIVGGLFDV